MSDLGADLSAHPGVCCGSIASRSTKNALRSTSAMPRKRTQVHSIGIRRFGPQAEMASPSESALLDWNDDRLAFLGNKKIDSPRPLCRARVPDKVNSFVWIGAERSCFHHVRRAA